MILQFQDLFVDQRFLNVGQEMIGNEPAAAGAFENRQWDSSTSRCIFFPFFRQDGFDFH